MPNDILFSLSVIALIVLFWLGRAAWLWLCGRSFWCALGRHQWRRADLIDYAANGCDRVCTRCGLSEYMG